MTGADTPPSAPNFTLPDLKGKSVSLKELQGHVVVLNFWAFWCDTWKEEQPHLSELAKEQSERNFRLVAISVDGTRLQEFVDKTNGDVGFPVLLDAGGKVSASYRIEHVPTLIVLDRTGRIRYTKPGYPGNEAMRSLLRKLCAEKSRVSAAGSSYSAH